MKRPAPDDRQSLLADVVGHRKLEGATTRQPQPQWRKGAGRHVQCDTSGAADSFLLVKTLGISPGSRPSCHATRTLVNARGPRKILRGATYAPRAASRRRPRRGIT